MKNMSQSQNINLRAEPPCWQFWLYNIILQCLHYTTCNICKALC